MNSKTPQARSSYLIDGDDSFIGLNSKDGPSTLKPGMVSLSQNFRLEQGQAFVRKGIKKMSVADITTNEKPIYASCVYNNSGGVGGIALVVDEGVYIYNPDEEYTENLIEFPYAIGSQCTHIYQAQGLGSLYVCFGFGSSVLKWSESSGTLNFEPPGPTTHTDYPNTEFALYFGNRHIVKTGRSSFKVSGYLSDTLWSSLDKFNVNSGLNDEIVAITPWQLNEFVIFMRNSIFYANVGIGANAYNDLATDDNSYIKSLATDAGCIARRSIVQAGGGVIFLSDNGVFMLNPNGGSSGEPSTNTPEGMRLITMSEPLSLPINDIIQRINYSYVNKAVASYHENRYYLAIPLDESQNNNCIIVYNFLIKAWESVDTYPDGFDAENLVTCKRGNKLRLFAIDSGTGVLLLDELDYDEYGNAQGTPILPFTLGDPVACKFDYTAYTSYAINGQLITRGYTFDSPLQKRYSSLVADLAGKPGTLTEISVLTTNPEQESNPAVIEMGSDASKTIRLPVRKQSYYAQIKFKSVVSRPKIKSIKIKSILTGENIHTIS